MRWVAGAMLALGLWFAALVALTLTVEPTRAVVVFAPDRIALLRTISLTDVALLDGSDRMMRVAGASPGFVARLYAAGAWLVLPARPGGCIAAARKVS